MRDYYRPRNEILDEDAKTKSMDVAFEDGTTKQLSLILEVLLDIRDYIGT